MKERRDMIEASHPRLSIRYQCGLLSVCRSGLYYKQRGESELNLELMRLMDEHYLEHPEKGARRMYTWLIKDLGYEISRNRVERLYYKVMGLRAILPGPHTSKRCNDHAVYPYLLRNLEVTHSNHVWAMDITYIPMRRGFLYLVAIIDLYSRYIVHWGVSNTMTSEWCQDTVREAIEMYGTPEILNTDQGSQFTSPDFTNVVTGQGIKLSMDGKGRATDNAFIERFWRSIRYEQIYIYPPEHGVDLLEDVEKDIHYYNTERRHQSIDDKRPGEVYHALKDAA